MKFHLDTAGLVNTDCWEITLRKKYMYIDVMKIAIRWISE